MARASRNRLSNAKAKQDLPQSPRDLRRKRKLNDDAGAGNVPPPAKRQLRSSENNKPSQTPSLGAKTKAKVVKKVHDSQKKVTLKGRKQPTVAKPTTVSKSTMKRARKPSMKKAALMKTKQVSQKSKRDQATLSVMTSPAKITKKMSKIVKAVKKVANSSKPKTLARGRDISKSAKRKTLDISPDESKEGKAGSKKKKKGSSKLTPKLNLPEYEVDPTFESNLNIPFVSTLAHSRLLIRAVLLDDMKLLKKLVYEEPQKIYTMCMPRSFQNTETVIDYILKNENKEAFKLLHKVPSKTLKKFGSCPSLLLGKEQTGYGSTMMFGHALRQVSVGRGGKEGNNAFMYDSKNSYHLPDSFEFRGTEIIPKAIEIGTSKQFVDFLTQQLSVQSWDLTRIHIPLRKGHFELVGFAISKANKQGGYGFNFLHEEVLVKTTATDLTPFKPVSVVKKCMYEPRFTPLHCAAINPNVEILKALLRSMPDFGLADRQGWTVGHYAAVCQGPEPLKYLLQFGISAQAVTSTKRNGEGYTLLHAAVSAGRPQNVKVILNHEEKLALENPPIQDDADMASGKKKTSKALLQNDIKYKLNTQGQNALHMACALGHLDIVEILLKSGMDASIPTPAKSDRVTPLIIAAMYGHLEIVKTLVETGVKLEVKDKRGRTAAHYAAINGHAHVLSYLLRLGVNHLAVDTSGNSLLHYSAAYGWYFNTMLCLEAGCPPNAPNLWKMSPMAVAFMKGHTGLVNVLIECEGVDVNARINDANGRTLLLDVCSAGYEVERLKFLIEDLKADPLSEDFDGNNALHLLAENQPRYPYNQEIQKQELKKYFACVSYLIEKQCDPKKKNVHGASPLLSAAKKNNFDFIAKILELKVIISFQQDERKNTILHYIASGFTDSVVQSIFNTICNNTSHLDTIKGMCLAYNGDGFTPLLLFLQNHRSTLNSNKELLEKGQNFVQTLLEKFDADVNAQVKAEQSRQTALHLTVGNDLLPTILKYNPSLNIVNADSKTPLVTAVLMGELESAEKLIEAGANVNFCFQSEGNISLLLYSVMRESKSFYLVPKLIAKGANPKEVHPETKNSILHYIASKPNLIESVSALQAALDAGVDPNLVNSYGRTALHLVVNARGSETDVFYDIEDALISAGANITIKDIRERNPLHYAFVKTGNPTDSTFFDPIELVSYLVSVMKASGATRDIHSPDIYGSTPLHYSAFRGATICSSYLFQTLSIESIDMSDKNGNTPFGLAVRNHHEGCALNFLQKGADFLRIINNNIEIQDLSNEEKSTQRRLWKWEVLEMKEKERDGLNKELQKYPILEQVVKHDWQGLLYLMVGQLQSSGSGFSTGIATALKTKRFKLAYKLVLKVKRNDDFRFENGSLFHTLAKNYQTSDKVLVEKICDKFRGAGLDPTVTDDFGSQPVIYALVNKNMDLCNILLGNKNVVNKLASMKPDLFGRTPFTALFWDIECLLTSEDVAAFANDLIVAGANPNQLCEYPIHLTMYAGSRYIKKLANIIPSNNSPRFPALIIAVIHPCYLTVKRMLTQVARGVNQVNVNVQDSFGRTALMHAVRLNDIKMVKVILDPINYDVSKDIDGRKEIKVKSSNVNPRITDKKGWTVMDHLILSPGNSCYHKNVHDLIKLLHQIGALSVTSADGTKPIERAAQCGRNDIVQLISTLTNVPPSKRPQVSEPNFSNESLVTHLREHSLPVIKDFHESAKNMVDRLLEKEREELKMRGEEDTLKTLPDPLCGLDKSNAEVMIDSNQDTPFDCLMTKVDISYGIHGLYNFYKMQLIKQPRGKEMILLFTQWGRVGQEGQFQKTPFASEDEAIKEFMKIFKAKSGNDWGNVKNFVPVLTKYRLVKKDLRKIKLSTAFLSVKFEELEKQSNNKKSVVSESTLSLIKRLSLVHKNAGDNYSQVRTRYRYNQVSSEPSYDNLPLLPLDILVKAEEILQEIGEKIQLKEKMEKDFTGKYVENDKMEVMNDIVKLSESFYEIIPVYGYSTEKLEPIFFDHDLRSKLVSISHLTHLALAKSFLLAAQHHQETVNPWEYIYRCLDCKIQLLDQSNNTDKEASNIILQYIYNTGENVKVKGIYRVERQGENERLMECGVDNRQLLWHGTSEANMLAILKQGLQIAPLGSQISGDLFGKGIYLADCFKKSQKYCRTSGGDNTKVILLCEAALGKIFEVDIEAEEKRIPKGYNSLKSSKSKYEPDPASTVIWNGRTTALGKLKETPVSQKEEYYYGLDHNEFIIFNTDQIAIRYLILFQG